MKETIIVNDIYKALQEIPQYEYIKIIANGFEYEGNFFEVKNNCFSFYTIPYTSELQTIYLGDIIYVYMPSQEKMIVLNFQKVPNFLKRFDYLYKCK